MVSETEDVLSKAYDAAKEFVLCDARGTQALEVLAQRFPQLYLTPAAEPDESASADVVAACAAVDEAYKLAAQRGIALQGASVAHFASTPADELRTVQTPAGPVQVLYLAKRSAFEMFLQCIGHKAHAVPIAKTIGAMTYRGINDWGRIGAAQNAYECAGGEQWLTDRATLAKLGAFKSELIIISEGPYSNISADKTPFTQEKWLQLSREIRLYHECAHVVCRRTMPDDINPLWDEITADMVGLIKATGAYDPQLATVFLGVSAQGYSGGRFEEYVAQEERENINELAVSAYNAIQTLATRWDACGASDPFEFLLEAKRNPYL